MSQFARICKDKVPLLIKIRKLLIYPPEEGAIIPMKISNPDKWSPTDPLSKLPKRKFRLGELEIDSAKRTVTQNGEDIILDEKEYGILLFLVYYRGQTLPWDFFYNVLWNHPTLGKAQEVIDRISHLQNILLKVQPTTYHITLVDTDRGVGFCFEPLP